MDRRVVEEVIELLEQQHGPLPDEYRAMAEMGIENVVEALKALGWAVEPPADVEH